MRTTLLLVDPQNDFCSPRGSLFVPGADADCRRIAAFIRRRADTLDSIIITLDTHALFHIAHPLFWRDAAGAAPPPYTVISRADAERGAYRPADPRYADDARRYTAALEARGRFRLTLWPPHCLAGSWGWCIEDGISAALGAWQERRLRAPLFVFKGGNPLTEHYSAVKAEVPREGEADTQPNERLLAALAASDAVYAAGEALSHCLAFTLRDAADAPGGGASRFTLLTDCASCVAGFEREGEAFIREMTARGMKTASAGEAGGAGAAGEA